MTSALVGLEGRRLSSLEAELLRRHRVPGVLLLGRNVGTADELTALCAAVDDCVRHARGHPALIAVDQEGGAVSPLGPLMGDIPSPRSLGRHGDVESTEEVHLWMGRQAHTWGVNFLLTPVADVDRGGNPVIATRAFGGTPSEVSEHVAAALRGLRRGGVRNCLKHWPGHGASRHDSHYRLPRLDIGRQEWEEQDLPPFEENRSADAIMVAHLDVPALDDGGRPSSVSSAVVGDYLRERWGFPGLIVSDALEMEGFANLRPSEAVRAGCDLVLLATPVGHIDPLTWKSLQVGLADEQRRRRIHQLSLPMPDPEDVALDLPWWWGHGLRRGPRAPTTVPRHWGLLDFASGDRLLRPSPVDGVPWAEGEVPVRSPLRREFVEAWGSEPRLQRCFAAPTGEDTAEVEPFSLPEDLDALVLITLRPLSDDLCRRLGAELGRHPGLELWGMGAVGPDFQTGVPLWDWNERPWVVCADVHDPARVALAGSLDASRPS